jgi:hypothetical protein
VEGAEIREMTVEDAFAQPASDVTARLVPDEHPFGRLEQPLPEIRDRYSLGVAISRSVTSAPVALH